MPLFDSDFLNQLEYLSIVSRRVFRGSLLAQRRTMQFGSGIEFAEHREYAPGDDLRYVDWKVFGKSDRFYLKQFEEETNLICYLLLDISESMNYRGPDAPLSKLAYAQCAAASLAYLVLRQRDSAPFRE